MQAKARKIQETPVAEVVARGEVELGFQEVAEILPVAGAQLAGRIPDDVQQLTSYEAAVATRSAHKEAAARLVAFLAAPRMAPLIEGEGLMPPREGRRSS